ncbi:MAG: SRPBCC family protein [Myxococcota bacterium]|nr:SRPBCC family protein [Myxococcota bacterium]
MALLAALALVAVLGLLAAGGWSGQGRTAAAIELQAPPERVFSHLVQPELLPRWLGGLVHSESLTPGEPRVGARSRETLGQPSDPFQLEVEITRLELNKLLGLKISHPEFLTRGVYVVKDRDGRTTLISESTTQYHHPVSRLFSPLATRLAQVKLEEDLLRLKALLEGPTEPAVVAAQEARAAAAAAASVPVDPEITSSDSSDAGVAPSPAASAPAELPEPVPTHDAPAEPPPAEPPLAEEPPVEDPAAEAPSAPQPTPEAPGSQPAPTPDPPPAAEEPAVEEPPPRDGASSDGGQAAP